jgi:hypothetical protein
MYQSLGTVTLKNGEQVEAGVIVCPDVEWSERISTLLSHKASHTRWQIHEALTHPLDIETYFYILHRDGILLSNIMTVELGGVGIFGHVWTTPAERQKGASSSLMPLLMEHFVSRGGRALFLGTDFDGHAYRMYQKFGFRSVEAGSDYMEYYTSSNAAFEDAYFRADETVIQPIDWVDWPSSQALFGGDFPGMIRCASMGLIGRAITENPFLPLFYDVHRRLQRNEPSRAFALRSQSSGAVLGLALWSWHPMWLDTCLIDIYCHPDFWDQAEALYSKLDLPKAHRYLAYADVEFTQKIDLLRNLGFREDVILKEYVPTSSLKTKYADVLVFEKRA